MRALFLVLMLLAFPALAAEQVLIFRHGQNSVRIMNAPCHKDVVDAFPHTEQWSQAVAVVDGKRYIGCWEVRGHSVALQYLDGDLGVIPVGLFTQDHGA